jgi:hypothetical protein
VEQRSATAAAAARGQATAAAMTAKGNICSAVAAAVSALSSIALLAAAIIALLFLSSSPAEHGQGCGGRIRKAKQYVQGRTIFLRQARSVLS